MNRSFLIAVGTILLAAATWAQVQAPPAPWRGAGPTPCVGSDGGVFKCAPAPRTIAIRAGRLFDSKTGQMLTRQVVLVTGDRITDVGAEGTAQDSGRRPGHRPQPGDGAPGPHRRAHAHVQHARTERDDGEVDAHRRAERAGRSARRLHRGARHELARQRLRRRRDPQRDQRRAASTAPGTRCRRSASCGAPRRRRRRSPQNPLASTVVRSVDEARAAVREQIAHGADWIKLFPTGGYSFDADGQGAVRADLSDAGAAGA